LRALLTTATTSPCDWCGVPGVEPEQFREGISVFSLLLTPQRNYSAICLWTRGFRGVLELRFHSMCIKQNRRKAADRITRSQRAMVQGAGAEASTHRLQPDAETHSSCLFHEDTCWVEWLAPADLPSARTRSKQRSRRRGSPIGGAAAACGRDSWAPGPWVIRRGRAACSQAAAPVTLGLKWHSRQVY
jgi:hypothetical protein